MAPTIQGRQTRQEACDPKQGNRPDRCHGCGQAKACSNKPSKGCKGAAPAEPETPTQAEDLTFVFPAKGVVRPAVEGVGPEGEPVQALRQVSVDPGVDWDGVQGAQAVRMARRRTAVP